MPFYKYKCKCGNAFTVQATVKEYERTKECPVCHQIANRDVRDIVSSFRGDKDFYDGTKVK